MEWYYLGGEIVIMLLLSILLLLGDVERREDILSIVVLMLIIVGLLSILSIGLESSMVSMGKVLLLIVCGMLMLGDRLIGLEYSLLVVLFMIGSIVLMRSNDLISLYIGLEIQSLSGYLLVGWGKDIYKVESSLKYFIVGSVGSGILLLGGLIVYLETGSVSFNELCIIGDESELGVCIIVVGLLCKLGGGGYYQWWIDVLEGSEIRSSGLVSIVGKISLLLLIVKICIVLRLECVNMLLMVVGMMSLIVSGVGCYYQRKLKRFIGYSSLLYIGGVLCLSGLLGWGNDGISVMKYLILYCITSIGLWCIIEVVGVNNIEEIKLRISNNGYLKVGLGLLILSMIGMPPLYGFIVKIELLFSLLLEGGIVLLVLLVCLSVLSGFNYLRWLKMLYYEVLLEDYKINKIVLVGLLESIKISLVVLILLFGIVLL